MASRAPQLLVAVVCAVATMEVEATSMLPSATSALVEFWELVGPGGRLHPAKFLEYGGHIIVETILLSIIVYFLLQRSFKPSQKSREPLTEREIQSLCDDWQPEPLYPTLTEEERNLTPVVIDRVMGSEVQIGDRWVLSMASYDYLSLADSGSSKEVADNTICKYGVGSCGPRGFYGTIDVHLQLEERLARFMGTEEAIMYSYDLATLPSVLPAFASKKDVIVCDEAVNYAIRNGCHLSKATVLFFRHNDPQDLERILQQYIAAEQNARKPLNRRFIVVEGIYTNYGDIAPLKEIWEIKQRYKFRLVVDESLALGALGPNGRGACEHWQLPESDVEIRTASLGNAIASVGGFCAGSHNIVEHQRLSGNGYVFSASLPPFLATVAMNNLQQLSQNSHDGIPRLQQLALRLRTLLKGAAIRGLGLHGTKQDGVSPLLHLHLKAPHSELPLPQQLALLQRVADHALEHHDVLLAVNRMTQYDQRSAAPSLKLIVTVAHSEEQLQTAASAVRQAADAVLCS